MTSIARSYLFVPGNRPERFERACNADADAVIVDLEDAVPPDQKDQARASLAAWLSPAHPVLVRVNAAETPWHQADVALCRMPGVAGIVLPKAEHLDGELVDLCRDNGRVLLPLIETALKAGSHHGSTFYEHQKFNAAVRGVGPVEVTARDGLMAVAIGTAAEISARERRVVELSELGL